MVKAFGTSLIWWPSGWLALSDGGGSRSRRSGEAEKTKSELWGVVQVKLKKMEKKMKNWIVCRD